MMALYLGISDRFTEMWTNVVNKMCHKVRENGENKTLSSH